jgi:hypothetical protein
LKNFQKIFFFLENSKIYKNIKKNLQNLAEAFPKKLQLKFLLAEKAEETEAIFDTDYIYN